MRKSNITQFPKRSFLSRLLITVATGAPFSTDATESGGQTFGALTCFTSSQWTTGAGGGA